MLPPSSKPYLVNAIYEWCVDQGYTPYMMVKVDKHCRVPQAYVRDGSIVLNVNPEAVKDFVMSDGWVGFTARFNGVAQMVSFPITAIAAVYARETQEGMGFEVTEYQGDDSPSDDGDADADASSSNTPPKKPTFSLVE
ncbi:ClpXP protease specificity-enhancing factor [Pelistega europaea]|uniref:ClpXP protease specificity-enhancing factor n=1 Tax=Pelistega europaea TaxID=106147 RepID=A0A7Y4LB72_9BURK|nr:ClpXP protease specificity-enhancing factor [Pelistega europaea]NOL50365.1 ClpXP protease specificity-enhancing factor [Pelistega europaea]